MKIIDRELSEHILAESNSVVVVEAGLSLAICAIIIAIALFFGMRDAKADMRHHQHRVHHRAAIEIDANANPVQTLGGRPAECFKWRATRGLWCGCAAALEVGLDNSDGFWNYSGNWFTLPRAAPGNNMAVVRSGHVAILKSLIGGTVWWGYDPNSGHQQARMQPIDTRNYAAIVDPHGTPNRRMAQGAHPADKPTQYASTHNHGDLQ